MSASASRGADIVQALYGGALYQQGRGFYSALELFAILRGEVLLERRESEEGGVEASATRVLPVEGTALYLRRSHDHARRLLATDDVIVPGVLSGEGVRGAIRSLLEGLEAPVPGRRRANEPWRGRHFYPYPPEAIHYDAVPRGSRVSIETYTFRGAGGLAHKILRTDPDAARLDATRERLRALLSDSGGAVGNLLVALARHDAATEEKPFEDDIERRSLWEESPRDGQGRERAPTRWMELLREGTHRVLAREGLSDFERVDALMHWVPFCLARHQLAISRRRLDRDEDAPLVFDAGHGATPVRTRSRDQLARARSMIREALLAEARATGGSLPRGSAWWKGPLSFFATTLYAVGALNANTGRRHFEFRPNLLQTVVHALLDTPMPFDRFVAEVLGERLRVITSEVADDALVRELRLDGRALERNGESLAGRLDEVGLCRSYSDSTLMVGVHE